VARVHLSADGKVLSWSEQQLDVRVLVVGHAEGAVDQLAHAELVYLGEGVAREGVTVRRINSRIRACIPVGGVE
jgi:hypothetical protein